ncbi:hypothetical protein HDU76_000758 [Blyttiomyces sp. JEL0837]|nr:hypothetical protein HDU76_000758 [Blyttiomyces sp. JEL0837]
MQQHILKPAFTVKTGAPKLSTQVRTCTFPDSQFARGMRIWRENLKSMARYDPHTKESRGFAFVSFEDIRCADEALEAINGRLELHGRIIRVDKAKRARAREPTPGRYFGPPKRNFDYRPPDRREVDRYRDDRRYDDRRDYGRRETDRYDGRDRDRRDDYRRDDRYDPRRDYDRRDDRRR